MIKSNFLVTFENKSETSDVNLMLFVLAFCLVVSTATGLISTAVTWVPKLAANIERKPLPQPISRTSMVCL